MIVVGSINRDITVHLPTLPKPGETVVGDHVTEGLGGKGANQAVGAATLGSPTWIVGCVGEDAFGDAALAELAERNVDVTFVDRGEGRTGIAQISVDRYGENQIGVAPGANTELRSDAVAHAIGMAPCEFAVVLASLETPIEAILAAAKSAEARGFSFVLNPAPARALPKALVERCSVLTPNEHELLALSGTTEREAVENLFLNGAATVVVTLGARGADLHQRGGRFSHQPAIAVDVLDTTGAGDSFNAALAVALAERHSLIDAVRWGIVAGALACRSAGAQSSLPDRATLEGSFSSRRGQGAIRTRAARAHFKGDRATA